MLTRKGLSNVLLVVIRRCSHIENKLVEKLSETPQFPVIDTRELPQDDFIDVQFERRSVLEECKDDISHVAPYLKPTFNFAAYVNKSETLQQLVKLGVDLHKVEKKPAAPQYILKLDFERDIKKHLIFLSDLGVKVEELARIITKNPFIFKEDLDDLTVRINYLKSKNFTNEMITRIVSQNPYWLMFNTEKIDKRLGFFQKQFTLTGDEIRKVTIKQPRVITYSIRHIKLNTFVFNEEMGFTPYETKSFLLRKPNLFMKVHKDMLETFEVIHRTMSIPLERIAEVPEVLLCRPFKVKQRYLFLQSLDRAQFNARKPNYVPLISLVAGSDVEFCNNIAKSTIQTFNTFLKTL